MSLLAKLEEGTKTIHFLVENCRLFAAREEYDRLKGFVNVSDSDELRLWEEFSELHTTMIIRSDEIKGVIRDCSEVCDDSWTLGNELLGVKTHYRVEDDGFLCLRLEGLQEIILSSNRLLSYMRLSYIKNGCRLLKNLPF
jgi:hypothetical protein